MRISWVIVVLTTILYLETSANPTHHKTQQPSDGHHLNKEYSGKSSHGYHQNYETGKQKNDNEDCGEDNVTNNNQNENQRKEHQGTQLLNDDSGYKRGHENSEQWNNNNQNIQHTQEHQGAQLLNGDSGYKRGHENSEQWNSNNQNQHLLLNKPNFHHDQWSGHQENPELWSQYQNTPHSFDGPHVYYADPNNHPNLPGPNYHSSGPGHINLPHLPELLQNLPHHPENYPKVNLKALGLDEIQHGFPNVQFVHIPGENGEPTLVHLPVGVHPSKVKIFYPGQHQKSKQPIEIKPKHHQTFEPQHFPNHHSEEPIISHDVPGPVNTIGSAQSTTEAHATATSEVVNNHPQYIPHKPQIKPHHGHNHGPIQKPQIPHYQAPHILKHPHNRPSENQAHAEASASSISIDQAPENFKPNHVQNIPIHDNVPEHENIPVDHGWKETPKLHLKPHPHHEIPTPQIPKHKEPIILNTAQAEAKAVITVNEHPSPKLVHKKPHIIIPVPKSYLPIKPVEHKPVLIPQLPNTKLVKSQPHDVETAHIPKDKIIDNHLSKFSEFIEKVLIHPHHNKKDSKIASDIVPSNQEPDCDQSTTTVESKATASASSTAVSSSPHQNVPVEDPKNVSHPPKLHIIPNHGSQWPQLAKLLAEIMPLHPLKIKSSFAKTALDTPKSEKDEEVDCKSEVVNVSPTSAPSPSNDNSDTSVVTTYSEADSQAEAKITEQAPSNGNIDQGTDQQSGGDEPILTSEQPSSEDSYSDDEEVTKTEAIAESETKIEQSTDGNQQPIDSEGWYYVKPGKHPVTHFYAPLSPAAKTHDNDLKTRTVLKTTATSSVQTSSLGIPPDNDDDDIGNDQSNNEEYDNNQDDQSPLPKKQNPSTTSSAAEASAKSVVLLNTPTNNGNQDGKSDDQIYWQSPSDALSDDIVDEPVSAVISTEAEEVQSISSVNIAQKSVAIPAEKSDSTINGQDSRDIENLQPKKISNYRTADRNDNKTKRKNSPFTDLIQNILNLNNLQNRPSLSIEKKLFNGWTLPQKPVVKSEASAKSSVAESSEVESSGKYDPLEFFIKLVLSTKELLDKARS